MLFVIWGLLGHGGSTLQDQAGTLVLDKQTGQAYVFCQHGELCPVVNYASARLALQSSSVTQQTVTPGLAGQVRPRAADRHTRAARRCPTPACWSASPGRSAPGPPSARPVRRPRPPWSAGIQTGGARLGASALLAQAQGQDWVIWNAERLPIQPDMLSALSTAQQPMPVPPVWLDALPQGPAFAPPAIPGQGSTVTGPAGPARVGQVYQVTVVGSTQYYVMLSDGLAPISRTQAALLNSEPGARQASLQASQVSDHRSAATVPGGGLPASIPAFAAPGSSAPLCVVYAGGTRLTSQIETGGQMPAGGVVTGIPADVGQVALPPGAGALVGDAPGTGLRSGAISYFLVAAGRRYALASTEVAGMLGYSLSQAAVLPAGVVDLIPAGPALDPAQAARPVPGSG